ncbi:MAG: 4Fe-4S dicluster domain-containing protein [Kiritimatiellae bacterium]|nr:4Fe-4S dicluster domain-containing protein [Kiritimatiellia bacterium]
MAKPIIDEDCCKGCGRCAAACPKGCLALTDHFNKAGLKPVAYKGEGCTGCATCFYNCPEPYAIKVER